MQIINVTVYVLIAACTNSVLLVSQARDVRTNEVVAIKKMSYSGKQSNEVRKLWPENRSKKHKLMQQIMKHWCQIIQIQI